MNTENVMHVNSISNSIQREFSVENACGYGSIRNNITKQDFM